MWAVWKYQLTMPSNVHDIEMPEGADILAVQKQMQAEGPQLCIWAKVNRSPGVEMRTRRLYLVGTGHVTAAPDYQEVRYVGSVQDGRFVWHLFDAGEVS